MVGRRKSRIDLWISLLLAAAVALVYGQACKFAFLNFDDPDTVQNPHVIHGLTRASLAWAFRSTENANWHPLTWISYMAEYQLWGSRSGADHVTNLVLHAGSAILLFLLLARLTRSRWASAFVALVFALHPLHVESVAWVAERKDVLSALFWMLTMWAYSRYVERPGALHYLLMLAAFALGLMAKPMLVTLPFALLLLDVWPFGRLRTNRGRAILEKLPMIALACVSSMVTYAAQSRAGAVSPLAVTPLGGRIENALTAYVAYLVQFVWPANLAVFYPYRVEGWLPAALAGTALAAITIFAVRMRRHPYFAVGWFWYLGTLIPVIGLVQVGSQARADRYTYIPLIGISIMIAFGVEEWVRRGKIAARTAAAFAIAISIAWTGVTWRQVSYWRDSSTLFAHAIAVTRDNDLAWYTLGEALRKQGRIEEAIVDYQRALAIRPESGEAQNNLGEALLTEGRIDQAFPHLEEAVRLEPKSSKARVNLATALNLRGHTTEAEAQYRLALVYDPDSAEAHGGLGVVLNENGRTREALAELGESVRLNPEDAAGHYNLGRALAGLGRTHEAAAQFAEAVRLNPSSVDAHISLGAMYAAGNDASSALQEFQTAERIDPNSAGAHLSAGTLLADLGRREEALAELREALRLRPDLEAARQMIRATSQACARCR